MTTNTEGYDDTHMRLAVLRSQYDDLVQRMRVSEDEAQRLMEQFETVALKLALYSDEEK